MKPPRQESIDAVRPLVNRQIGALMDLQQLTGARPGELLGLRACDLETGGQGSVWMFRLRDHKNAHRQIERAIYFGPKAQQVLRPFLLNRPLDAFLFSPREAEAERRAVLHSKRKTPMSCGNRPGTNRSEAPAHKPGSRYTTASYRKAIDRACDEAFPPPERLRARVRPDGRPETRRELLERLAPKERAELAAWREEHRWHPSQLRHAAATRIRAEHGLEAAQLVLGHASVNITDAVYAERDAGKVIEVMRKLG